MANEFTVDPRLVGFTRCVSGHPSIRVRFEYYPGFYCEVIRRAVCLTCGAEQVADLVARETN